MEKISIIIPVYNVEDFVKRCIESILNQTYQNFELILINDGSTDNSLNIINEYKNNKKVKIYTQKNHGAAYTRNFGLKKSTGRYVTFIDSDDYVENDYLYNYVSAFQKDTDIVLGGYTKIDSKGEKSFSPKLCEWDVFRFSATCGKMYLREFLIKNNIEYGNTEFLEDVIFNLSCLFNKANYTYIDYTGYNYVYNSNSISNNHGRKKEQIINIFSTIRYIDNLASKLQYKNEKYLINYYFNTYLFMVFMCCRKAEYSFLKDNVNEFMEWITITYPNWKKEINKIKEVDTINKIVIAFWKGAYNIKLSNLLLLLYSKL